MSKTLCTSGGMVSVVGLLAVWPKKKKSCTTSCLVLSIICGNIIVFVHTYSLKKNAQRGDHLPSPSSHPGRRLLSSQTKSGYKENNWGRRQEGALEPPGDTAVFTRRKYKSFKF